MEEFSENWVGRLSNNSPKEPMNYFGELSNKFSSEGCPIYFTETWSLFSRTKTFCFEKSVFLTFGLGIHEGVSEGSGSGKG